MKTMKKLILVLAVVLCVSLLVPGVIGMAADTSSVAPSVQSKDAPSATVTDADGNPITSKVTTTSVNDALDKGEPKDLVDAYKDITDNEGDLTKILDENNQKKLPAGTNISDAVISDVFYVDVDAAVTETEGDVKVTVDTVIDHNKENKPTVIQWVDGTGGEDGHWEVIDPEKVSVDDEGNVVVELGNSGPIAIITFPEKGDEPGPNPPAPTPTPTVPSVDTEESTRPIIVVPTQPTQPTTAPTEPTPTPTPSATTPTPTEPTPTPSATTPTPTEPTPTPSASTPTPTPSASTPTPTSPSTQPSQSGQSTEPTQPSGTTATVPSATSEIKSNPITPSESGVGISTNDTATPEEKKEIEDAKKELDNVNDIGTLVPGLNDIAKQIDPSYSSDVFTQSDVFDVTVTEEALKKNGGSVKIGFDTTYTEEPVVIQKNEKTGEWEIIPADKVTLGEDGTLTVDVSKSGPIVFLNVDDAVTAGRVRPTTIRTNEAGVRVVALIVEKKSDNTEDEIIVPDFELTPYVDREKAISATRAALETAHRELTSNASNLAALASKLNDIAKQLNPSYDGRVFVVDNLIDITISDSMMAELIKEANALKVTLTTKYKVKPVVLHRDSTTNKWEVVEDVTLNANGSITLRMNSLSPIAFLTVDANRMATTGGIPTWVWIVCCIALVLIIILIIVLATRKKDDDEDEEKKDEENAGEGEPEAAPAETEQAPTEETPTEQAPPTEG